MQAIVIALDPEDRDFLSFVLRHTGLAVAQTAEVQHIKSALRFHTVDLIVLVLDPQPTTETEIEEVRALTQAPIILLSERLSEGEQCDLLDAGVDLILERPVSPRLLSRYARILLRRSGPVPQTVLPAITAGDLSLDPVTRQVRRNSGEPQHLAPLEFRLLYLLMTNQGHVIPVETIVERVWGYGGEGNRELVRGLVRRLRRKLAPGSEDHQYIENLAGVGYRFVSHEPPYNTL